MVAAMVLFAMGCIAPEVVVTTHVDTSQTDTAAPVDTAAPDDTGTPPPPSWNTDVWAGVLQFSGDVLGADCDADVVEEGTLLPADDPHYKTCPTCSDIYALTPSTEVVCGAGGLAIVLENPTIRGIRFGDGFAMVYNLSEGTSQLLDANANFQNGQLDFSYTESIGGSTVSVMGTVSFPKDTPR